MERHFWGAVSAAVLLASSSLFARPAPHIALDRPATDDLTGWAGWSLPLGNGWFGVSVFGIPDRERLQITHNAFLMKNNLTSAMDLRLSFGHGPARVTDYRRTLDLSTAVVKTVYTVEGVTYTRTAFTSYPGHLPHLDERRRGREVALHPHDAPSEARLHPPGPRLRSRTKEILKMKAVKLITVRATV